MAKDFNDINKESTLVSRTIKILGKRTSIRLEPEMWKALKTIADRETCFIYNICSLIKIRKNPKTSLTSAIRVFIMLYFRAATTEEGHRNAGHGNFENMKRRAGVPSDWDIVKQQEEEKEENSSERDEIGNRLNIHIKNYNNNHAN